MKSTKADRGLKTKWPEIDNQIQQLSQLVLPLTFWDKNKIFETDGGTTTLQFENSNLLNVAEGISDESAIS